jgi:hypothetical protein
MIRLGLACCLSIYIQHLKTFWIDVHEIWNWEFYWNLLPCCSYIWNWIMIVSLHVKACLYFCLSLKCNQVNICQCKKYCFYSCWEKFNTLLRPAHLFCKLSNFGGNWTDRQLKLFLLCRHLYCWSDFDHILYWRFMYKWMFLLHYVWSSWLVYILNLWKLCTCVVCCTSSRLWPRVICQF